ncbi:HesB/YadR/YfhF family protein [Salipaludibacillus daqingensis]|uniref:HesB/YadR/YfhF family protein n=1 Tax=Salipaludibacillus daqingensis TaxID=3041001 RepID=UPI00247390E0|nr:HesB/YadR/YfhF family protein [Salipaludibacillus daqingensis]
MNMTVTDEALKWFKNELEVKSGDSVQFFVRYGGCGDFQTGFSLGVAVKTPDEKAASIEKEGILFYVEKKDEWYFDGQNFAVSYDEDKQEISFGHDD